MKSVQPNPKTKVQEEALRELKHNRENAWDKCLEAYAIVYHPDKKPRTEHINGLGEPTEERKQEVQALAELFEGNIEIVSTYRRHAEELAQGNEYVTAVFLYKNRLTPGYHWGIVHTGREYKAYSAFPTKSKV